MQRIWIKVLTILLALFMMGTAFASEIQYDETGLIRYFSAKQEEAGAAPGIGIVQTQYGLVSGVQSEDNPEVTIFKGIPYAAPPVGDLRWKAPQDPESWEGVRACDAYADGAMQWAEKGSPWLEELFYDGPAYFSEDCLYLNVATTAVNSGEKKPVYVWFHGGGLRSGYSYEKEFDNDALAKKGIVVVTVAQRLGIFGYMSLPQLSEESGYGASGNYGLMDQFKALEWVYNNIEAFGGDPNNITFGGQSGGGMKMTEMIISPKWTDGHVKNLIFESCPIWTDTYATQEENIAKSQAYLEMIGLDPEMDIDALRQVDTAILMGPNQSAYLGNIPMNVVQDGEYIDVASNREAFETGKFNGFNMIIGANYGEGYYSTDPISAEEFYAAAKETYGDLYNKYDFENLVKVDDDTAYAMTRALSSFGETSRSAGNFMQGSLIGRYMNDFGADSNVYSYYFTHVTPGPNMERDWAWHNSEMWYCFGSYRHCVRDWDAWDYELSRIMNTYWANFMYTGDPNGVSVPEWPRVDSENLSYLELGDSVVAHTQLTPLEQMISEHATHMFGFPEM